MTTCVKRYQLGKLGTDPPSPGFLLGSDHTSSLYLAQTKLADWKGKFPLFPRGKRLNRQKPYCVYSLGTVSQSYISSDNFGSPPQTQAPQPGAFEQDRPSGGRIHCFLFQLKQFLFQLFPVTFVKSFSSHLQNPPCW